MPSLSACLSSPTPHWSKVVSSLLWPVAGSIFMTLSCPKFLDGAIVSLLNHLKCLLSVLQRKIHLNSEDHTADVLNLPSGTFYLVMFFLPATLALNVSPKPCHGTLFSSTLVSPSSGDSFFLPNVMSVLLAPWLSPCVPVCFHRCKSVLHSIISDYSHRPAG